MKTSGLIAFFNQLSGINAVLYFAPRIFELAWVRLMVPETKGVPLEEIEHRLTGRGVRTP